MSWDTRSSSLRCDGREVVKRGINSMPEWCARPPALVTSFYLGEKLLGVRDYCVPCSSGALAFAEKLWNKTADDGLHFESRALSPSLVGTATP